MNQITEDYCSFEIAKLLKEKGFDIPIHAFYNPKKSYMLKIDTCLINRNAGIYVSAPTHQMALKWLREVHKYVIIIDYKPDTKKYFSCIKNRIGTWVIEYCDSYEQAAEAAILYVLKKLI